MYVTAQMNDYNNSGYHRIYNEQVDVLPSKNQALCDLIYNVL